MKYLPINFWHFRFLTVRDLRAYVDGKKVDLIKANSMYMGIELKKGKHEIVLTYCTPYIVPGLILTATGLLLFLLIAVSYRKSKKSWRKGKTEKMSRLSVVLPAYNEEQILAKTCRTLKEILSFSEIRV